MKTDKLLVEFHADCGRMGFLSSTFVTTREKLDKIKGKEVYFGEVLGKHSEIYGPVKEEYFTILNDDQSFIKEFEKHLGEDWSVGHNPFHYWEEDD